MTACSIDGCGRLRFCRGWCKRHYERWRRHGNAHTLLKKLSDRGLPLKWIQAHINYKNDDCLIWPFARFPGGRAHMKAGKPSRIICEIVHGRPPTPYHEAAHSCGNGLLGCVNPRHLRWATPKENAADKVTHGTLIVGENHYAAKLNDEKVRKIRSLKGKMRQKEIAELFGVKIMCISKVLNNKTWKHV